MANLKKELSPLDIWGLALGAMIGWGCFVLPGNAFLGKAGPLGTALGMLFGAIMIVIIGLSYSYLISKFPVTGGGFIYAHAAFGKTHAFICGWFLVLAYWSLIPLNGTAIGLIGRYLFPGILQRGMLYNVAGWDVYAGEICAAIGCIVIIGLINMRGVKLAGWLQSAVSLILVGSIFLVCAVFLAKGMQWDNLSPGFPEGKGAWTAILAVVAMTPWAFIGFDCIPQAAEEYSFSHKKTLGIMISAILIAAFMYVSVNTITASVMPWTELLDGKPFWATGLAIEMVMGKIGLFLIGMAMLSAVISGLNAFYLSTSRLMYAMAKADALPQWFAKIDEKHQIPKNGIIFVMVLSIVAPFFGREVLLWIVDMTSVGASLAYGYTAASSAVIAKRNGDSFYFTIGVLGTLSSIFFLVLLLVPGMPGFLTMPSLIALLVWVIIGIAFYIRIKDKYSDSKIMDTMIENVCDSGAKL